MAKTSMKFDGDRVTVTRSVSKAQGGPKMNVTWTFNFAGCPREIERSHAVDSLVIAVAGAVRKNWSREWETKTFNAAEFVRGRKGMVVPAAARADGALEEMTAKGDRAAIEAMIKKAEAHLAAMKKTGVKS